MIYSLRGKVTELSPAHAVLDVQGIGYYVGVSLQTSSQLTLGAEVQLYTQQIIREDAHLLFGFFTREERSLFNLLISVTGVGAASALMMLSSFSLEELAGAIQQNNAALLQKAKGIGAKTAERIIVDLRDKVKGFQSSGNQADMTTYHPVKDEALAALEVLGIARKIAEKTADRLIKQDRDISTESLVKQILKSL